MSFPLTSEATEKLDALRAGDVSYVQLVCFGVFFFFFFFF